MLSALNAVKGKAGVGGQPAPPGQWSQTLFACDKSGCGPICAAFMCPCIPMASTHAMLNGRLTPDAMDCICASWPNVEYFTRRRIREVQNIPSDTCTDCLTIIFCLPCSILQDQAEVKNNSAKFMAIGATAAAGRAVGNLAGGMM